MIQTLLYFKSDSFLLLNSTQDIQNKLNYMVNKKNNRKRTKILRAIILVFKVIQTVKIFKSFRVV